jgi:type I restriction enzyme S subunit
MSVAPQTAAPSGRKKAIGNRSLAIGDAAKPPAALGHEFQNTPSPEGAKESGKVNLGELSGGYVAQDGPQGRGEFTYVDIGSIDRETKRIVTPKGLPVAKAPSRARQVLKVGDILVSMTRPNLNAVALVPPDLDGAIGSTGFDVLRPKDAEPGFLYYAVQTTDFIDAMCQKVQGALYPAVRPKDISSFCLLPSSWPQQRRIVEEIEKQFTRLEAGVAALRRVQANLKRYRAAVLKAACEGKLVPTEAQLARVGRVPPRGVRPNAKNAASGDAAYNDTPVETGEQLLQRILAERRQNWQGRGQYKEPAAPDTINHPPLPEGWTWATVEQLSTRVQYGSSAKANEDSDGVPVLRMGNIQDGKFDFDKLKYLPEAHDEFPELLLARGDLLFNRTNSAELVGKTAVFKGTPHPCSFASYLIRVRFGGGCFPDFVSYFINSVFGRAWIGDVVSQQVGQANVNGTKLQALAIPLPPLAEQTRIVMEVERRLSVVEELEVVVSANLQRATRLRQSILQKAFTGKLAQAN